MMFIQQYRITDRRFPFQRYIRQGTYFRETISHFSSPRAIQTVSLAALRAPLTPFPGSGKCGQPLLSSLFLPLPRPHALRRAPDARRLMPGYSESSQRTGRLIRSLKDPHSRFPARQYGIQISLPVECRAYWSQRNFLVKSTGGAKNRCSLCARTSLVVSSWMRFPLIRSPSLAPRADAPRTCLR